MIAEEGAGMSLYVKRGWGDLGTTEDTETSVTLDPIPPPLTKGRTEVGL